MDLRRINSINIAKWLIATCILFCCYAAAAQSVGEVNQLSERSSTESSAYSIDVNIFNRYDDHQIDSTYMGNRELFTMLDSLMRDTTIINHTRRIEVVTSSSIEGRLSYNRALSERRMQRVEQTLRSRYDHIDEQMWDFSYEPENWAHLRKAVVEDQNVPSKRRVLEIIDLEDRTEDDREYLLKILDDGEPWSYIHQDILPSSRGSVSMLFVPKVLVPLAIAEPMPPPNVDTPPLTPTAPTLTFSRPILSLRSNLLIDLLSTLNVSVEAPLAPRWSISAEYINPWWRSWNSAFTWQIESLYFDVRYWLGYRGSHNYMSGWAVGLYAGTGCYDLEPFTDRGVQGEYSDFGLTLSYAHNLGDSRHWLMEYTVGLGYVTTHYRHYYTATDQDGYGNIKVHDYPWSEETMRSVMPTRLAVTLLYLINVRCGKRGGCRWVD